MNTLLCHAGAWNTTREEARQLESEAVELAISEGKNVDGLLDAVEAVVNSLENHPALDAGFGSIIQMDGRARMDAGLADSQGRYAGIVQIEEIRNPISVARKLLEYEYHQLLSAEGALNFALEQGFKKESVMTEKRQKDYEEQREEFPEFTYKELALKKEESNKKKLSTVGCVGRSSDGSLIAASSTGGLGYGYPGRVADSALFGQGIYCSEHVAVSCTGEGEIIMRTLLAKRVEEYFLLDKNLQVAAEKAIQDLLKNGGEGGLIALSSDGQQAIAYNTKFLATASC